MVSSICLQDSRIPRVLLQEVLQVYGVHGLDDSLPTAHIVVIVVVIVIKVGIRITFIAVGMALVFRRPFVAAVAIASL